LGFVKQKSITADEPSVECFLWWNMAGLSNLALNEVAGTQTKENVSDILSVPEACRFLSVHRNTLYKLIRAGELPAFRLITGGHWRFRKGDLSEWLETRRARSTI